MDYREYEAATAALYQALGEGHGIEIEGFGAACRVKGKSGASHQIDVLVRQSNGLQTIRTAIECKYWGVKVGKGPVEKLVTILNDANIEKGAIVSKEGFTSGAVAMAKQHNISLVEMREPREVDWEGKIKSVHIMLNFQFPELYDLELMQSPQQAGEGTQVTAPIQYLMIQKPGEYPEALEGIIQNAIPRPTTPDQVIEVSFPTGTTLQIEGIDKHPTIDGVRFKVKYDTLEHEIVIDAAEGIRFVVKAAFEGRQFHVGYDGRVTEIAE